MAKHIIITKLFEFGGSNTHLKTLINYFGEENVILVLEDQEQLSFCKDLLTKEKIKVKVYSKLHAYAHLRYRFTTNVKEFFKVALSILSIQILSLKYNFAHVTISSAEPEKYLYLLWLPLSKVTYILHTTPIKAYTPFTSYTCNMTLSKRKRVITVSYSNRDFIYQCWNIAKKKKPFVEVVYNCLIETNPTDEKKSRQKNSILYVVTLGHVIDYKNPHLWLEVAKQVTSVRNDVYFIWLGNGPLLKAFEKATESSNRIIFKGLVRDPVVYLSNAAIYYQPSLYETHGIAVLEAMYCRLPCVVSNSGGLPESVLHQFNGLLVHSTKINEHVNAILSLVDSAELRKEYGLNGYAKFKKQFDFQSFKEKMDSIYLDKYVAEK
jgi:glycosyltransferase involved in cell wall biosynthesis